MFIDKNTSNHLEDTYDLKNIILELDVFLSEVGRDTIVKVGIVPTWMTLYVGTILFVYDNLDAIWIHTFF